MKLVILFIAFALFVPASLKAEPALKVEQYCLNGEFNIGARYQGQNINADEFHPTLWCITYDNQTKKVEFKISGHFNSDMGGENIIKYIPPSTVELLAQNGNVNAVFQGALIGDDARTHRRIDPNFLLHEINSNPSWIVSETINGNTKEYKVRYPNSGFITEVSVINNKLKLLKTWADLPLRGRVPISWHWDWSNPNELVTIHVEDDVLFKATASRRSGLNPASWLKTPSETTPVIPGKAWPARQAMSLTEIGSNTFLVSNVRTGFHHLVVNTDKGLIIADAPSGWVEIQQIPPKDMAPGLGVSGLSEMLIDFLLQQWPNKPIHAVVLTHFHDDHAGGARAFSAHGAKIYSHFKHQQFLQDGLNSNAMPTDQLSMKGTHAIISPIKIKTELGTTPEVILHSLSNNPHTDGALALEVPSINILFVSDIHVPSNDKPEPNPNKVATDCWFAKWATQNLTESTMVHNSHNNTVSPTWRLGKYLATEECRNLE